MSDVQQTLLLARPDIRDMQAYSPRRLAGTLLDNNESPWPPAVEGTQLDSSQNFFQNFFLNRYPSQPLELQRRLAKMFGVRPEQVLATRGSDDGIDALIRTFCAAGKDSIIVSPPTFGMYAVMAMVQGANVIEVPLGKGFGYPRDAVVTRHDQSVKLVFVCSPNNPTGTPVPQGEIARLCESLRGKAVVVVDEAYAEFMQEPDATALLARFDNLVVLRTLSKAFALAGARCGVMLGAPEVLALVRKVLPPYLLPQPTVAAAEQVLSPAAVGELQRRIQVIVNERQRMHAALEKSPGVRTVYPSAANFLLIEFEDAGCTATRLERAGLIVRRFEKSSLANALRISVGLPEENDRLLQLLENEDVENKDLASKGMTGQGVQT